MRSVYLKLCWLLCATHFFLFGRNGLIAISPRECSGSFKLKIFWHNIRVTLFTWFQGCLFLRNECTWGYGFWGSAEWRLSQLLMVFTYYWQNASIKWMKILQLNQKRIVSGVKHSQIDISFVIIIQPILLPWLGTEQDRICCTFWDCNIFYLLYLITFFKFLC